MNNFEESYSVIRKSLEETFDEILGLFSLPADKRSAVGKNGDWTINETLEHVSLVNRYLIMTLRRQFSKAVKMPTDQCGPVGAISLAPVKKISDSAAFTWESPRHMLPTGRAPVDETRNELSGQKAECLRMLEGMKNGEGFRRRITMSVGGMGKIDLYQWIYFIAMHMEWHLSGLRQDIR
ncbi:MAG: DinB family protein [Spirochaetes bacterium]|jgi:hypothetical protein|nr:DinB family protein [Spirochaetota bacterium]